MPTRAASARASSRSAAGTAGECAVSATARSPSTSRATAITNVESTPAEKATSALRHEAIDSRSRDSFGSRGLSHHFQLGWAHDGPGYSHSRPRRATRP